MLRFKSVLFTLHSKVKSLCLCLLWHVCCAVGLVGQAREQTKAKIFHEDTSHRHARCFTVAMARLVIVLLLAFQRSASQIPPIKLNPAGPASSILRGFHTTRQDHGRTGGRWLHVQAKLATAIPRIHSLLRRMRHGRCRSSWHSGHWLDSEPRVFYRVPL